MLNSTKIAVFVPAYNAARHLESVFDRIPDDLWRDIVKVWIINDGSTDDTAGVADTLARRRSSVCVHSFERNLGYGAVVKKGLALCRREECDVAACLHGDGQYPPEEMRRLAGRIFEEGFDIVQGSRIASGTALSGGMPLYKYAANRVLTFFENRVFGLHLTDYHSGYLVYSRRALESVEFERLSPSFDIDLEIIAAARARGLAVGEAPIPTRYADEISHLNPVGYGLRVVRVMIRYLLGGYR